MKINLICGDDEFLVESEARRQIDETIGRSSGDAAADDSPDLEIIGAQILVKSDFQTLLNRLADSILTLPLFGPKKIIWLKSVDLLKSAPTESAQPLVDKFFEFLERATQVDLPIFISASPIDRRLKIFKRLVGLSMVCDISGNADLLANRVFEIESQKRNLSFPATVRDEFLLKVGNDTRLIANELEKLSLALDPSSNVESRHIREIVCAGNQERFFDLIDAFYSSSLPDFTSALEAYFRFHVDGRPLIAALQNRNRLLIQLKVAASLGAFKIGGSGMLSRPKIADLYGQLETKFYDEVGNKSASLMAQNVWYLSKIAVITAEKTLKTLVKISETLFNIANDFLSTRDHGRLILRSLLPFFAQPQ